MHLMFARYRPYRLFLPLVCALWLAGCATPPAPPAPVRDTPPPARIERDRPLVGTAAAPAGELLQPSPGAATYTVKAGDTLIGIALDHGVDYRDLAGWNNIDNPNRIRPGQLLRVAPAASAATPASAAGGAEVRPIAIAHAPVGRTLDAGATANTPPGATAVPPAPTFGDNSAAHKRSPKGGKWPYSAEQLARLAPALAAAQSPQKPASAPTAPPVAATTAAAVAPPAVPPAAPPAETAAVGSGETGWQWPAGGKLIAGFDDGGGGANKGIDIGGKLGDPVRAAAAGKVIYVGTMKGYGNLAIVLHADGYSSVYAHNSRILVKEQQMVTRGQTVAELGDSDASEAKLHFEIRRLGKPQNPLKYLPAR